MVNADAKYLRSKAEKYAEDAKVILEKDMAEFENLVKHRGIFNSLSTFFSGV